MMSEREKQIRSITANTLESEFPPIQILKELLAEIDQLRAELAVATEALDKIRDPRKRCSEPNKYTELKCVMSIADEALSKI